MKWEHETTAGELSYNDGGSAVESYDNPVQPDGDGWELVSSVLGPMRLSVCAILWFWRRPVTTEIDPLKP